jgi:hypothetical protein
LHARSGPGGITKKEIPMPWKNHESQQIEFHGEVVLP